MNQCLSIYLTNLYYNSVGYYILISSVWHAKLIESDELSFCIHTVGPIRSTFFVHCRPPPKSHLHRYLGICFRELSEDAQKRERENRTYRNTWRQLPQAVPSAQEAEKKLGWSLKPTVLGGCPYL